jgi:hypothetical protein
MALNIRVEVFRVVTPWSVDVRYRNFEGYGCLHLQFTLKVEAARSSETLVSHSNTIWRSNPEDLYLNFSIFLVFLPPQTGFWFCSVTTLISHRLMFLITCSTYAKIFEQFILHRVAFHRIQNRHKSSTVGRRQPTAWFLSCTCNCVLMEEGKVVPVLN